MRSMNQTEQDLVEQRRQRLACCSSGHGFESHWVCHSSLDCTVFPRIKYRDVVIHFERNRYTFQGRQVCHTIFVFRLKKGLL